MQLLTLGSSSKGNCYILQAGNGSCLVLEAGVSIKEVKKAVKFRLDKICGVLVTHEHGDHAEYVKDYQKYCIPVYTSKGTASHFQSQTGIRITKETTEYQVGDFKVIPFAVNHDAEEPFGYHISHPEMGTLLFGTDCASIPYQFDGIDHFLIECNYDEDIILENCNNHMIATSLMERIQKSHMSLTGCIDFLKSSGGRNAQNIILCHLSALNSDFRSINDKFYTELYKVPKIAQKGVSTAINKFPY